MDYGAIGIGVGIAGVIFAGLAWLVASRSLKYQMLAELMREYAQSGMNNNVATVWNFYDKFADDNKKLEEEYLALLVKEEPSEEEDKLTKKITAARRRVSHFYQRMAALHESHVLPDKLLYRIWATKDLRIIPEVIIPLERAHGEWVKRKQKTMDVAKEDEDNKVFELLTKLYEHSKGPGITFL